MTFSFSLYRNLVFWLGWAMAATAFAAVVTPDSVNAAPQAYFVEAQYFIAYGPPAERTEWKYQVGAPVTAVFVWDHTAAPVDEQGFPTGPGYIDVTDNPNIDGLLDIQGLDDEIEDNNYSTPDGIPDYASQFAGQKRYIAPSVSDPSAILNMSDPLYNKIGRDLNGINYINSNGLIVRRIHTNPDYIDTRPIEVKVSNDVPAGPSGELYDFVTLSDGVFTTGPAGAGMFFTNFSNHATLSSSAMFQSFDTSVFNPANDGHPWAWTNEGNQALVSSIRAIEFGDSNGDGVVDAADFDPIADNYNKEEGTYGYGPSDPDYPFGPATWLDGDFDMDGLVTHADYEIFYSHFIPGDANFDGAVDIFDVAAVSNNWGSTTSPRGDVTQDGVLNVDIFDIAVISNHWGQSSQASAVPEPSSVVLAVLACTACLMMTRRKLRSSS